MFDLDVFDTRQGDPLSRVKAAKNSGSRQLNVTGSGQTTFDLDDTEVTSVDLKDLTRPWHRTIVTSHDDGTLYGGLITARTFDHTANTLTIRHSDIREIFSRRNTLGVNGYSGDAYQASPPEGHYPLDNLTLASIAPWVVELGEIGPDVNYTLQIALSDKTAAGSVSRDYRDWDFQTTEDALDELTSAAGGPDLDFYPRIKGDGKLEWVMRAGTQAAPSLTGNVYEWNMSAPQPGLFDVSMTEDATKQATRVYAVGSGSEGGLRVAHASVTTLLPALDIIVKLGQIDDLNDLQSHADSYLAAHQNPTEQWSLSMLASAAGGISNMPLGSTLRLWFENSKWISNGWHDLRLIGFDFDETETVKLKVQPIGGS